MKKLIVFLKNVIQIILIYCITIFGNIGNLAAQSESIHGQKGFINGSSGLVKSFKEIEASPLNVPAVKNHEVEQEEEEENFIGEKYEHIDEERISKAFVFDVTRFSNSFVLPPQSNVNMRLTTKSPSLSFLGSHGLPGNARPSDASGAAGPDHFIALSNEDARIINKTSGQIISQVSIDAFMNAMGTFDARIFYDPYNQRFVALALNRDTNAFFQLAVSDNSDPMGGWHYFTFDVDSVPGNNCWLDFANLGFNKDWVAISGRLIDNCSQNLAIIIIDKTQLYANAVQINVFKFNTEFNLAPALTYDNSDTNLYFIQTSNSNLGGNGYCQLKILNGPLKNPVLTTSFLFGVNSPWRSNIHPSGTHGCLYPVCGKMPQQLGTTITIENVRWMADGITTNCVFRNGKLYFTHSIFLPSTGTTNRISTRVWKTDPITGVVDAVYTIDDPTGSICTYFSSLAVTANNDIAVGYSYYDPDFYPGVAYTIFDSLGNSDALVYKTGYTFDPTYRMGDYSATTVDPIDDRSVWTVGQVEDTAGGTTTWMTWVALIPEYRRNCAGNMILSNTNFYGNRKNESSDTIKSRQIISGSSIVDYDAGKCVVLQPGFKASEGTSFHVYIDGCGGAKIQNLQSQNESFVQGNAENNLLKVVPNPFSSITTITYSLQKEENADVKIYSSQMQLVANLLNQSKQTKGEHQIDFEAGDLPSGIYLCKLETADKVATVKIVLSK
ncbi:MAG: 3-coathanger stack domain-containing protein [Bacteroidia bacterium]